jgi:hypothetical protein
MDAPQTLPALAVPAGLLPRLVDSLQRRYFPGAMDTATARWAAALVILLVAIVLGRFAVGMVFSRLKKISVRANNQLMVPALEPPAATLVILCGVIAALSVVPLWDTVPNLVRLGEQGSLTAVLLWGIACAGGSVIDHFAAGARARKLHIAAFIPLIKRTPWRSSRSSASSSSSRAWASR